MTVSIDNRKVLASGVCVLVRNQAIMFQVKDNFKVEINFANDSDGRPRIASNVDEGVLKMLFYNFSVPNGSSNQEMLQLGTVDGKPLFLNFAHYFIGGEDNFSRVFHYTFISE